MANSPRTETPVATFSSAPYLHSPLTFPAPHQLSKGSPAHSASESTFAHSPSSSSITATTSATHEPSFIFGDTDEPDVGPPKPKRAKIIRKAAERKAAASQEGQSKPIVTTFEKKGLKKFSLFLPSRLPATIVRNKLAFANYITSTATTYISLWQLDSSMDVVDLRLPLVYSKNLSDDLHFLSQFLGNLLTCLAEVDSIKELYLPAVDINTFTDLENILQPLSATNCSVKRLVLPLTFTIQSAALSALDYAGIAKVIVATEAKEVTFVSGDNLLPQFHASLQSALTKNHKSKVKLSFSDQEMATAGPAYLTDSGQSTPAGENVDPHSLIDSLNTTGSTTSSGGSGGRRSSRGQGRQKERTKRAFSSDCSYSDQAQLSTDSTFASQLWDLERLHDGGTDGTGTTIAVLDSGISYTHPAFKDKIIAVRNFVPGEIDDIDCAIDSDGHGSLCAGIAAGKSFHFPLNPSDPGSLCMKVPPGVAPGAKLIICKVVDTSSGDVNSAAFLAALKWLKELHLSGTKVDVVSISLASCYYSQERAEVICDLTRMGVIIVCCASNVGRMRLHPIAFPARLGHVLCIGTHDANGKPTSFSPVGRELDFLAPGDDIWGPGPGTMGPFAMDCGTGTSCSAPAVAGLICLILHAVSRLCEEDTEEDTVLAGRPLTDYVHNAWVMREILKEMSSSPGHHSEEIGYGTLNPYRVLDRSTEEIVRLVNEVIEDE